jgi:Sushi repeat (SCR repeat)
MHFNSPLLSFLVLVVSPTGGIFAQRCPFPGIPANAHATTYSRTVAWQRRTSYRVGDKIEFTCEDGREIPSFHQSEIQCRNDGTWSGPLPRCGQFNNKLKLFTEFISFLLIADLKSDLEEWNVQYHKSSNKWLKRNPKSGCSNPSSYHWDIIRAKNDVNDAITEIQIKSCSGTFVYAINSIAIKNVRLSVTDRSNNPATVIVQNKPCIQDSSDPTIFNCENVNQYNLTHFIRVNLKLPTVIQSVSILLNQGKSLLSL